MASVNIGEAEFGLVADAALAALERGDRKAATALDVLARKFNAALTTRRYAGLRQARSFGDVKPLKWQDVPSVLDGPAAKIISKSRSTLEGEG